MSAVSAHLWGHREGQAFDGAECPSCHHTIATICVDLGDSFSLCCRECDEDFVHEFSPEEVNDFPRDYAEA